MRLGLIADIHGNLPALRAVLEAMGPVDSLLCAGDVVGYYPDANQVCEVIRALGMAVVRGNHDAYVVGRLAPRGDAPDLYRTEWTARTLTADNRGWLAGLPVEREVAADGCRIFLRHASPWDEETYLYMDSPALAGVALGGEEVLVVGHTHWPGTRRVGGGGLLVNPGSVGQPRDHDPRASYAILEAGRGTVELRRAAYDVTAYAARLRSMSWPRELIDILLREGPRPGTWRQDSS